MKRNKKVEGSNLKNDEAAKSEGTSAAKHKSLSQFGIIRTSS